MATDTQEISAPAAPAEAEASSKVEKVVFTGDYVPDQNGRVTFVVSFPVDALQLSETFRPVEGILGLATKVGLKGYGEGDVPQATLGVERAKLTDKSTGDKVDNPNAGRPTGTINLVLHTDASFAEAKKRGRTGMSDSAKKATAAASNLVKTVLSATGKDAEVQAIADRAAKGEIDTATALREIAALMA